MVDFADLARQNPWWTDARAVEGDSKIVEFESSALKWFPRLFWKLDLGKDVLYSLRGPRQVGKTTLVKLLVRRELGQRKACNVFYYACDLVSNPMELKQVFDLFLDWSWKQDEGRKLVCLDEVSRVKDWALAFKQVVDSRSIRNTTYILTGSSSWDLKHGTERLGGRKGEASGEQSNKVLLPMSFGEYVALRNVGLSTVMNSLGWNDDGTRLRAFFELTTPNAGKWLDSFMPWLNELNALYDEYLLTGGVIIAAKELAVNKRVSNVVFELYLQLLFGELAKLKRDEGIAKKFLSSVLKHLQGSVGWLKIAQENDLPSPLTVSEYADVLQNLFVLNVYNAFDQNTGQPRHRSEKKLQVPNPFFFHAFRGLLENPVGDFFKQALEFTAETEGKAALTEFVVGDHLTRLACDAKPTELFDQQNNVFYVKNVFGETIDFIVRLPNGFLPVEVKYQNQLSPGDYKNLKKFKAGVLVSKNVLETTPPYPTIPAPLFLLFA